MGYTKEQRESKVKLEVENKTKNNQITNKEYNETKTKVVLNKNLCALVKSIAPGELIYISKKTGEIFKWDTKNVVLSISLEELQTMKASSVKHFKNNWISVEGIEDVGYEDVTPEDIYNYLKVQNYYTEILCPKNIDAIFNWSIEDLKAKVPKMSTGTKSLLLIRGNELIEEQKWDSLSKIKALEEILNCEFTKE